MVAGTLALMLIACACGAASGEGSVWLAKGGRAVCSIILPPQPSDAERAAAEELRTYLRKISGAEIPIGGDAPAHIFLGRAGVFAGLPFDIPKLEFEHFLMRTRGGDLYLLGAEDAAVQDAVYTLLRDLGCRWFMPGEIGEVVPRCADIVVGSRDRIEGPDFSMRDIWFWSASAGLAEWCRRNRAGGACASMGHNLVSGPLPPEKYFKEHPEYYALVRGVRTPSQPCTSNPQVIDIVAQDVIRYFDDNPGAISYSLSPEDNADFCECPNCTALDSGRRDPGFDNLPVVTDRLVRFYNAIAERLQQKHPGKCVAFYAYFNHTLPPTTVRLHPNILVAVTAQQFCTLHSVADCHCSSRRKMAAIIEEYARQTKFVYIREYDPMPSAAELPAPLFGAHLRDMPWYQRHGVRGFSWESHPSWATLTPNHYILAQMMWDADQDPRALLADFYDKFFGPAGAPMARYYETLERSFSQSHVHPGWGNRDFPSVFTGDVMTDCRAALREAQAAARTAPYRQRVQMVALGFTYLDSWLALKRAIAQGDHEAAVAARARTMRALETLSGLNGDFILLSDAQYHITRADNELAWILPRSVKFRRDNDVIELPVAWRFRKEESEQGAAAWAGAGGDDSAWRTIRTDAQWWEQLNEPLENCRAWARTRFIVPEALRGRRLVLRIGALDEEGWIYVNGKLVHHREAAGENWDEPFEVDISDAVSFGQENLLAVRAQAETTLGGLWRGAVVYSPRPG